jgi:hypothetical protein
MSRKELLIAGLLLAVAVAGGGLIPRLLASPAAPFGMALGPGPARSVVQAPTVSATPTHETSEHTSFVSRVSTAARTPVAHATVKPPPAARVVQPKQPAPVTTGPPPVTTPTQPPAAAGRNPTPPPAAPPGQPKTPPGQAKKLQGPEMTPPGQLKTPPGQQKTPPGHQKAPPGDLPRGSHGKPTVTRGPKDLPGSAHGTVPQAPPHSVGHHDRGVGHLSATSARPAAAAPHPRQKARPQTRGSGSQGGHQPPSPQVAGGHGHGGNGKGSGD